MSFLVVDDSGSQRTLLRFMLNKAGYRDLLMAASEEEALEFLGLGEERGSERAEIEIILMDIHLGKTNGIDLCRRIKSEESLQDIPVVMVTGSIAAAELGSAYDAGAFDHVMKPVNKVELVARVRSAHQYWRERRRCRAAEIEAQAQARQLTQITESQRNLVAQLQTELAQLLNCLSSSLAADGSEAGQLQSSLHAAQQHGQRLQDLLQSQAMASSES